MADKKKVFSIVINGVKEAVDMTKSLNSQLADLEKNIDKLSKKKINIQGAVNVKQSSSKGSDVSEKELALQKQLTAETKATAQAQAALTEEYRRSLIETEKQKAVTNDVKQGVKDMLKGATDEAGNYTNTLAGMRAELRDMSKELASVELGSEEYAKIDKRVLELTTNIKALEAAHGDFRRNVGNYPTEQVEALNAQFALMYADMQKLVGESNALQTALMNAAPGTQQYSELSSKLKQVNADLEKSKQKVDEFNASLNASPKNFTIEVNGNVRQFENAKQGVKALTKELQQMAFEGKTNTAEYKGLMQTLGQMKTVLSQTSGELSSFVGNAKGLSDTLEVMQGVTGLASISQGISGLFGGANKELDETLKKFSNLMMIMQGLEKQYKALQDPQSIWGQMLSKVWNMFDNIGKSKSLDDVKNKEIAASEEAKKLGTNLENVNSKKLGQVKGEIEGVSTALKEANASASDTQGMKEMGDAITDVGIASSDGNKNLSQTPGIMGKIKNSASAVTVGIKGITTAVKGLLKATVILAVIQAAFEALTWVIKQVTEAFKGVDATERLKRLEQSVNAVNDRLKTTLSEIDKLEAKGDITPWEKEKKKLDAYNESLRQTGAEMKKFIKMQDEITPKSIQKSRNMSLEDFGKVYDEVAKKAENSTGKIRRTVRIASKAIVDDMMNEISKINFDNPEEAVKRFRQITDNELYNSAMRNLHILIPDDEYVKVMDKIVDYTKKSMKNVEDQMNEMNILIAQGTKRLADQTEQMLINSIENQNERTRQQNAYNKRQRQEEIRNSIADEATKQKALEALDKEYAQKEKERLKAQADENRSHALEMYSINKTIRDNRVALMQEGLEKQKTILRNQWADEIEQAKQSGKKVKEQIQAINDKYNKLILDAELNWYNDNRKLMEDFHREMLNLVKEYEDEYRRIRLESEEQAAEDQLYMNEQNLNASIEMYTAYYSELLEKYKGFNYRKYSDTKKFQKEENRLHEDNLKDIANEEKTFLKETEEYYKQGLIDEEKYLQNCETIEKAFAEQRENEEIRHQNVIQRILKTNWEENSFRYSTYLGMRLDATKDYIDEEESIYLGHIEKVENLTADQQNEIAETYMDGTVRIGGLLKMRYDNELIEQKNAYEKEIETLTQKMNAEQELNNERAKSGQITEEQYWQNREEIQLSYHSAMEEANEGHQLKMKSIEEKYQTERLRKMDEFNQKRKEVTTKYYSDEITNMNRFYRSLRDMRDGFEMENTNRHTGLFNPVKEKKMLQTLQNEYDAMLKHIQKTRDQVEQDFKKGLITAEEMNNTKNSLDELEAMTQTSAKRNSENLKDLFQNYMSSINSFAGQIASQIQSAMSIIQDIQDMKFDMQEEALDKEQEQLDRENSMIEDAMSKQSDIIQKYKDKINQTEDKLKDARGERRIALLEQLEAQKHAYQRETDVLKQQEKEKEKIAEREERLKKKQDALEKKRKEAQKQADIISAIINTALGVTQALGAYPPPASTILAAAIGALGAAQVATIASQKFADGGVIDGPSHARGGVKVLGGRAEIEGGEYIINKKSTAYNEGILSYINSQKRPLTLKDIESYFDGKGNVRITPNNSMKFAQGGMLPQAQNFNLKKMLAPELEQQTDDRPVIVQVVDIANSLDNYRNVQTLAGL